MKAIQVKYLPSSEKRGLRVKAWVKGHSVTVYDWDLAQNLGEGEKQKAVAMMLAEKLDWKPIIKELIGGCLPNGDYAFTIVPKKNIVFDNTQFEDGTNIKINIPFTYTVGEEGYHSTKTIRTVRDAKDEVLAEIEAGVLNENEVFMEVEEVEKN